MNDYLNVFEHYKQDRYSIPLENNLTRIFARICFSLGQIWSILKLGWKIKNEV